ncbi:hypothetical protein [Streptomyces sp. MP131-18]|uniref:hypothetical protein n=1 Tax=Streptomyces sp. MP131-18 TaxID=1857892 RepID=UPI00097CBE72|nr:hypothetical protein [Streptomyces sp. MP131-18]
MTTVRDTSTSRGTSLATRGTNQTLTEALKRAGWSSRDLVRALNPRLTAIGEPILHLTAAQGWLRGSAPRSGTVRRTVATLLTEATGCPYTAAGLWGTQPGRPEQLKTATDGLVGPRPLTDVLAVAAAWTTTSPGDQAALYAVGDNDLFTAVWDATRKNPQAPVLLAGPGADRVDPPHTDVLEDHLTDLRRLDDTAGGGALSQRYVRNALAGVLDLLHNSRYTPVVGTRLLGIASGMAQLAGWMAFDADLTAAAQRYQLLGIRLARAADDEDTIANVLGMLSYQHAARHKAASALRLAEAAVDHTARSAPVVRARALGRLATAHAAAGNAGAFRAATELCRTLLDNPGTEHHPPALYYFTPDQVAAESGHALVELAASQPHRANRLLSEATDLLTPLTDHGLTTGFKRSALLHGIHLARAHLLSRDATSTVDTLHRLASHLDEVQSIRCRNLLAHLRRQAGSRIHTSSGADALAAVDRALSAA